MAIPEEHLGVRVESGGCRASDPLETSGDDQESDGRQTFVEARRDPAARRLVSGRHSKPFPAPTWLDSCYLSRLRRTSLSLSLYLLKDP